MNLPATAAHTLVLFLFTIALLLPLSGANADSAEEIDINANATLKRFPLQVNGGEKFLEKAAGVLVFPSVIKAGFGIGGEYGEGVLRVDGSSVEYYSNAAASIGFQLGAQAKSILIVFLTPESLASFRSSNGWKVGVDGSVALIEWGMGKDINSITNNTPIVGFIFNNKGLMYNLTLEGSKFTRITR
jgi:lipid-binding SYLF domain-containing protein